MAARVRPKRGAAATGKRHTGDFLRLSSMLATGLLTIACASRLPQTDDDPATAEGDITDVTRPQDTIMYGVVPRSFGPAGLPSVTERLDDLQDLGVNALWLSPINATTPGDFGYAVVDYFEVRADYGTKDDLRELVQQAHKRGIRVLMDFVPNHTSDQHPYFQDAQAKGPQSEYYDWYDRDESAGYTYYFNWPHLPNLNLDNPAVQEWMLEALSYWVRELDIDGYRVDVAWGIKQRKPELWAEWIKALRAIKPDLLMLAEASARDPYYFEQGFDAAFDWTDELGHWAWENVFDERTGITARLHVALTNAGRGYHEHAVIFHFLNNNDTGFRFVTRHGPELTRVAAALLLTLPGIPCIYTGDEVGAEFRPYYDPSPIDWTDHHDLRDYYKQLVAVRKATPSLRSLGWQPLDITPAAHVYGYVRYQEVVGQPVVVLLNFSDLDVMVAVPLPQELQDLTRNGALADLLNREEIAVNRTATLEVSMRPWTARILAGA